MGMPSETGGVSGFLNSFFTTLIIHFPEIVIKEKQLFQSFPCFFGGKGRCHYRDVHVKYPNAWVFLKKSRLQSLRRVTRAASSEKHSEKHGIHPESLKTLGNGKQGSGR